ncbi:hypothetical protein LXL04_032756 [Taraxacum kok-saghyz]
MKMSTTSPKPPKHLRISIFVVAFAIPDTMLDVVSENAFTERERERAVQMRTIIRGGNGGTNLGHLFQFAANQFSAAGALLSAQHMKVEINLEKYGGVFAVALVRRGITMNTTACSLCPNGIEEVDHLLINCNFASEVFRWLSKWCDIPNLAFGSIILALIYGCFWVIWKNQNDKVFNKIPTTPTKAADNIMTLVFDRIKHRGSFGNCNWANWCCSPFSSQYLLRTHIFPRTPKPLTFSKNRLRGAKNRSILSPVAKKNFRKNNFFFSKTLHMGKFFFLPICTSLYNIYLKANFNYYERFGESRSRFFERNNGLGDIGNWGSSRHLYQLQPLIGALLLQQQHEFSQEICYLLPEENALLFANFTAADFSSHGVLSPVMTLNG